jgi:hypothetical protein
LAYGRGNLSYRQKKKTLNPKIVIVVLVILFLLLCLLGRGTFSNFACGSNTSELQTYINQVKKLTDRSNKVGVDFTDMRANIQSLARKDLETRLNAMTKDSMTIVADAEKLEVPEQMAVANGYLLVALRLRASAFDTYKPAIFNALEDSDLEVSAKQVSLSMKDLAFGDRSYALFKSSAENVLKDNSISFVTVPASVFLAGENEYEVASVLEFLRSIKASAPDLTETHGLAILEITVNPAPLADNDGIAALPAATTISVTVKVENQGNQLEVNIPVEAILKSETQPKPQTKKASIASLPAGQTKEITISGLKPTAGDIINMLTIQAGPVKNEKFLDNNMTEFKFTVEPK